MEHTARKERGTNGTEHRNGTGNTGRIVGKHYHEKQGEENRRKDKSERKSQKFLK